MKKTKKLTNLPLGSIQPTGFLRDQLIKSRDGMGGHLDEIEPGMIADPYIKKTLVKAWGDRDQSGWGAEISGSYYRSLVLLAYTLNDDYLIEKAEKWINAVLSIQREDGYLGTFTSDTCDPYEDFNAWGSAQCYKALLYYYEATGRQEAFDAVYKALKWFVKNWAGGHKSSYVGIYITEPMMYCYGITRDESLLDFCMDYQNYLCEHDMALNSYKEMLKGNFVYNAQHTVAYCAQMHLPALVYEGNGDKDLLKASACGIKSLVKKGLHITGAPVSATEYIGPVSSTHESEYCNFYYMPSACMQMARITSDSKYCELAERSVYNGAQGARRKDERAIAYFSAPNQIYATEESSPTIPRYQAYSPCFPVSCCPVNSVAVVPDFIRNMAMIDDEGDLHIMTYGPCIVKTEKWNVEVKTEYPFENKLTFSACGRGKIYFRNHEASRKTVVTLNGREYSPKKEVGGFFSVCVDGYGESIITVEFDFAPEVIRINDCDASSKLPLAIKYGALVFALPIKEKWDPYYPETETPLKPEWPWYSVNPDITDAPVSDHYEKVLLRKYHTDFNVALDENLSADDIEVIKHEGKGYPWSEPRVTLKVKGYRAPFMCAPYPYKTFEPFGKYQKIAEEKMLTLIPYGCTALRITYFPRAKNGKKHK